MAGEELLVVDEYEIEKLKAELAQEKQMKEMLDKSSAEMKQTVDQLEKRIGSIDSEGNEWKTRFETQEEINQQLQKQMLVIQGKMETLKLNLAKLRQNQGNSHDDLADPTPFAVKNMEKHKASLESQIKDLEWRLDQESKAYHKANDERKHYVVEINTAKFALENMMRRHQEANNQQGSTTPHNLRNIPEDQRVIDPKRGPIKKMAAVKNLPKLA